MIKGVAFDMDGTLTRPVLNFGDLRDKIGISGRSRPIYEQILEMPGLERERALSILETEEMKAAEMSEPNPGLDKLIVFLERKQIHKAIYTRNSQKALDLTLALLGLSGKFSPLVTRDHNLKLKPEPDTILHILDQWKLKPAEVLVVGDFEFDIIAGKKAKCPTVYINHFPERPAPAQTDFVIYRLDELIRIIEELNAARAFA